MDKMKVSKEKGIKKNNGRDSGIELLRIILMLGVMTLHFNKPGVAITGLSGSAFYFMNFTESIFICAVNAFMLVSGYYMCTSDKRKLIKPIGLLAELILMNAVWYVLNNILHGHALSVKGMVYALIPNKYFIILYICVYILSVYVNPLLRGLSKTGWRRLLITLIIMFAIWPTFFDFIAELTGKEITGISTIGMSGSGKGYTVIIFMLLYVIGAYIRLNSVEERFKNVPVLLLMFAGCVAVIMITTIINKHIMVRHDMDIRGICSALEYSNPIVILETVILFLIFKNIHFMSAFINHIAQAAFTCYITHYFFRDYFYRYIGAALGKGMLFFIGYWLFTIFALYAIGYVIHIVYNAVTKPVLKRIDRSFEKHGMSLDFKN